MISYSRPIEWRGIYTADCELCGGHGGCRLVMVDNRYLWACVASCAAAVIK